MKNSIGLVGRKAGMTRVFTDAGETVPVTVIEVLPNRVTQLKSKEIDGYRAVQVAFGTKRPQLLSKAATGHLAKAAVSPGRGLMEFRLSEGRAGPCRVGGSLDRHHGAKDLDRSHRGLCRRHTG